MFDRAVEIVLETRRGSVSLLQRRLAIGYTRASRLIDLMGIAGIIGEHKGSVAREVMITPEDWGRMKQLADEEARATGQAPVFSGERTLFPEATGEAEDDGEEEDDDEAWEDEEDDDGDEDSGDEEDDDEDDSDDDDEDWDEEDEVEADDTEEEEEQEWEETGTGGTPVPPESVEGDEDGDDSARPSGRGAGSLFPSA